MAVRLFLKGQSPIVSNKIPAAKVEAMVGLGEVAIKAEIGKLDVDLKLGLDLEDSKPEDSKPGFSAHVENQEEIPALVAKVGEKLIEAAEEAKLPEKLEEKAREVVEKIRSKKAK